MLDRIRRGLGRKPKEDPVAKLSQEMIPLREAMTPLREELAEARRDLRDVSALNQEMTLLRVELQGTKAELKAVTVQRDKLLAERPQPPDEPAKLKPISTPQGTSIAVASLNEAVLTARAQKVYKNLAVKLVNGELHLVSDRRLTEPEWRQFRAGVWMELLNVV